MILNNTKLHNPFLAWLIISFLLVYLMIIVGGITRLTDSGLSITEWQLFNGILPPLNSSEWNYYFSLYKKIPQYKLLNYNMSLSEFKIIYFWEYGHRLLGRIIGLFFLIPLIFFTIKKVINKKYLINFYIIFLLIIFQGIIGWYMVKSGLTNDVSVSHYRLALHLSVAFIIISSIYWNFLNIINKNNIKFFVFLKMSLFFQILLYLVFVQIVLGALVSGLDAGKLYQTWPLMNSSFVPEGLNLTHLKNLYNFNDRSLVQFYHRNTAYFISLYFIFIGILIWRYKFVYLYKKYLIILFFFTLQIILGIYTLISGLNIYLAFSHQFSSVLLFLSVLYLNFHYYKENINNISQIKGK